MLTRLTDVRFIPGESCSTRSRRLFNQLIKTKGNTICEGTDIVQTLSYYERSEAVLLASVFDPMYIPHSVECKFVGASDRY